MITAPIILTVLAGVIFNLAIIGVLTVLCKKWTERCFHNQMIEMAQREAHLQRFIGSCTTELKSDITKITEPPPEEELTAKEKEEREKEMERNKRLGRDIQNMLGFDPYAAAKEKGGR